jgi:hypothetical protein
MSEQAHNLMTLMRLAAGEPNVCGSKLVSKVF